MKKAKKPTAKQQVFEVFAKGLSTKEALDELSHIPKGTVSAYYTKFKSVKPKTKGKKFKAEAVTAVTKVDAASEIRVVWPTTFTRTQIIERIIDSKLVSRQKAEFVQFAVESF